MTDIKLPTCCICGLVRKCICYTHVRKKCASLSFMELVRDANTFNKYK